MEVWLYWTGADTFCLPLRPLHMSPSITRRGVIKRLIGYPAFLLAALGLLWVVSIRMPGRSFTGSLPALTPAQKDLEGRLRAHVEMLAGQIGERNSQRMSALDSAAVYIDSMLSSFGYMTRSEPYELYGKVFRNIEVTLTGTSRPEEIVVIGGHYDSVDGTPGADDNASGTAAVIELARLFKSKPANRTIKFVAFVNEEPPFFWSEDMGSLRYTRAARARGDDIVAMLSLETIGFYSERAGSQRYPPILGWFYPDRGNFLGVVGNVGSRDLVRTVLAEFRNAASFPSAGSAAPKQLPGIGWSDQWSFWKVGYDGVMITDTAPFRNDNYHGPLDGPATLNYDHMARVVDGVAAVVSKLAAGG